jgi:hypothetical protein
VDRESDQERGAEGKRGERDGVAAEIGGEVVEKWRETVHRRRCTGFVWEMVPLKRFDVFSF